MRINDYFFFQKNKIKKEKKEKSRLVFLLQDAVGVDGTRPRFSYVKRKIQLDQESKPPKPYLLELKILR